MKCLFVSLYQATPHFETELELMTDLLGEGHEVHVLRCTRQLATCIDNPEHKPSICTLCVSKIDRGLAAVRHPKLTIHTLEPVLLDPRVPREFASMDELREFSLDGVNLGRGAASSATFRINKDSSLDTRKYAHRIHNELSAGYTAYINVKRLLERLRPDRVYLFNARFSTSHAALLACQEAKVEFFSHERGSPGNYMIRVNTTPHDLAVTHQEIVEGWGEGGEAKENVAREWFKLRRAGADQSWWSFTKEQSVGQLPQGFDRGKWNIAIFNSTIEEYSSVKGWEHPIYSDEVVAVWRLIEELQARDGVHLYLRVHPSLKGIPRAENYQLREYAEMERRHPKSLSVIWPESAVHTYSLIDAASVVLTFGSTVGVEATFWKRPSVLAGRGLYENLDCVHLPKSHEELIRLITSDPGCKSEEGALKYAYWEGNRGTPYRHYQYSDITVGTFRGRTCSASFVARLQALGLRKLGL